MDETSNTGDQDTKKPLTLKRAGRIEIKRPADGGQVRQSFSRGRSKAVTVVVRKKRAVAREGASLRESAFVKEVPAPAAAEPPRPLDEAKPEPQVGKARLVLRSLTEGEKATRARALDDANRDADEARGRAEDDFRRRAEEEEVLAVEHEAAVPVAVTREAIQNIRGWSAVFVRYGNTFEARPLELGHRDGQWVEVLSGLSAGEQYVAKNSFVLKAEIGKSGASHAH